MYKISRNEISRCRINFQASYRGYVKKEKERKSAKEARGNVVCPRSDKKIEFDRGVEASRSETKFMTVAFHLWRVGRRASVLIDRRSPTKERERERKKGYYSRVPHCRETVAFSTEYNFCRMAGN